MKKIFFIIATLTLVLTACKSGDIIGGRYYGTFHNTSNNLREAGNMSFKYSYSGGQTYFLLNNLVPLMQIADKKFAGAAEGATLNDLLKTVPALDSLQICEEGESIMNMTLEAEFQSNSARANMAFITTGNRSVNVEFVGYFE